MCQNARGGQKGDNVKAMLIHFDPFTRCQDLDTRLDEPVLAVRGINPVAFRAQIVSIHAVQATVQAVRGRNSQRRQLLIKPPQVFGIEAVQRLGNGLIFGWSLRRCIDINDLIGEGF